MAGVEDGCRIRIELFGIALARAGVDRLEVRASTTHEALRRLGEACPGLAGSVIGKEGLTAGYLLCLNGERILGGGDERLREGDCLLVITADAGG